MKRASVEEEEVEAQLGLRSLPDDALAEVAARMSIAERSRFERALGRPTAPLGMDDYRRTFVPALGAPDLAPQDLGFRSGADLFRTLYESYDYVVRDAAGRVDKLRLARTLPSVASVLHLRGDHANVVGLRLHHPRLFFRQLGAIAEMVTKEPLSPANPMPRVRIAVHFSGEATSWIAEVPPAASGSTAPVDLAAAPTRRSYSTTRAVHGTFEAFDERARMTPEERGGLILALLVERDPQTGAPSATPSLFLDGERPMGDGKRRSFARAARATGACALSAGDRLLFASPQLRFARDADPRRLEIVATEFVASPAGVAFRFEAFFGGLGDSERAPAGPVYRWRGMSASDVGPVELAFEAPTAQALADVAAGRRSMPRPTADEIAALASGDRAYADRALRSINVRLAAAWQALPARAAPEAAARGQAAAEGFLRLRLLVRLVPFLAMTRVPRGNGELAWSAALSWRARCSMAGSAIEDRRAGAQRRFARGDRRALSTIEVALSCEPIHPYGRENENLLLVLLGRAPESGSHFVGLDRPEVAALRRSVAADLLAAQAAVASSIAASDVFSALAYGPSPAAVPGFAGAPHPVAMPGFGGAPPPAEALDAEEARRSIQLLLRIGEAPFFHLSAPSLVGRLAQYYSPDGDAGRSWNPEQSSYAFVANPSVEMLLEVTEGSTSIAADLFESPAPAGAEREMAAAPVGLDFDAIPVPRPSEACRCGDGGSADDYISSSDDEADVPRARPSAAERGSHPIEPLKESHEGSFTRWAKRRGYSTKSGVPMAAIEAGLRSKNPKIRRKAAFAKAARSWHHGGGKRH